MTAVPVVPSEHAVRDAIERLSRVEPGPFQVLSCYLKLEPRDKERGKYLIKMKNRVKRVQSDLARRALDHAQREEVAADLARVLHYFEDPTHLPPARGIALFACGTLNLFEALALPHVHRSRLAIAPVPLIRELVALEEEFGTILVAACDRTGARFFEVTAFDVVELPAVAALDASRGGKFHGSARRSPVPASTWAAPGSTTTTCGCARKSSGSTPRWPTASSRSTPSVPSRASWPRGSAWTGRRCSRTSTAICTTSCWVWCG